MKYNMKMFIGTGENLEWMHQEPNMRLLGLIKYTDCVEERRFGLIRIIQNECKYLGTVLGIDVETLNSFDKTGVSQAEKCTHILHKWIQRGESDRHYEVTWAGLLEALKDASLGGVAKQLEKALTFYIDTDNLTLQNCKLTLAISVLVCSKQIMQ